MGRRILTVLAAAFLLAGALRAEDTAAQAAYRRGQQFQTARQWTDAVNSYMEALKADPKFFYAYKSMGTVYYEAGDRKSALACYDRYLAMNPGDAPTRAFADKIRDDLKTAGSPQAAARAADEAAGEEFHFRRGFGLGADLLGLVALADDLNRTLPSGSGASYGSVFALGAQLGGDYSFANGLELGAGLLLGPNRSHTLSSSGAGFGTVTTTISNLGFQLAPGYRLRLTKFSWADLRCGLGGLLSNVSFSTVANTYSGFGWLLWPQAAYNLSFAPHWVGSAGVGYLVSSVTPSDSNGKTFTLPDKSTWTLNTGGLSLRLGVSYYFSPLI